MCRPRACRWSMGKNSDLNNLHFHACRAGWGLNQANGIRKVIQILVKGFPDEPASTKCPALGQNAVLRTPTDVRHIYSDRTRKGSTTTYHLENRRARATSGVRPLDDRSNSLPWRTDRLWINVQCLSKIQRVPPGHQVRYTSSQAVYCPQPGHRGSFRHRHEWFGANTGPAVLTPKGQRG